MAGESLKPVTFGVLRETLEAIGVVERDGIESCSRCTHVFQRVTMGTGSPHYTVSAEDDDSMVYAPVLRRLFHVLGVGEKTYAESLASVMASRG